MSTASRSETNAISRDVSALFDNKAPVLIEVRFPNMGTSSDWFLCEDEREYTTVLDRLGPGSEVHLQSVWDIASRATIILNR